MAKKKIKVYTKFGKIEDNAEIFAIIQDNVIKYIDFANNKMFIDMANDILIRENKDYLFNLNFRKNNINIEIKRLKKSFDKEIKTLIIEKNKLSYLVRYSLIDEDIINEYYIKF